MWKILRKKVVYKNKYVMVERWSLRLPGGERAEFFMEGQYDFVVVFCLTKNQQALLVNQYYISQGDSIPSLVMGIIGKKEKPAQTAARELLEETGFRAGRIVSLGSNSRGKYITRKVYYYLALEAEKVKEPELEPAEDIKVKLVSINQVAKMIGRGGLIDVFAELCARRAVDYLKRNKPI